MQRRWIRAAISGLCGFLVVALLYVASLAALEHHSQFGDALWSILDWAPYSLYGWIPHERGHGPTLIIILAPVVINMLIASILLYVFFSIWSRHRGHTKI